MPRKSFTLLSLPLLLLPLLPSCVSTPKTKEYEAISQKLNELREREIQLQSSPDKSPEALDLLKTVQKQIQAYEQRQHIISEEVNKEQAALQRQTDNLMGTLKKAGALLAMMGVAAIRTFL